MRKFLLLIIIILNVIIIGKTIIYAETNTYDAYDANVRVFYNKKAVEFKNPLFIINGTTYAPLREIAEKQDIIVEWEEDERLINTWKPIRFRETELVSNYLGYTISDESEIVAYGVNSDYISQNEFGFTQNDCFAVKIKLAENERSRLVDFLDYYFESPISKEELAFESVTPEYLSSKYSWWDAGVLTDDDIVYYCPELSKKCGFVQRLYLIRTCGDECYFYGAYISDETLDN